MKHALIFASLLCSTLLSAQSVNPYAQQFQTWHEHRMKELQAENGWLNLAGLFWLKPGINTFGTAKTNDFVFPEENTADLRGDFTLENDEVWLHTAPESKVWLNRKRVVDALRLFPVDTTVVLGSGSLRWFVVKRGDRYAVRLRNLQHPALLHFKGVDTYPADSLWRVSARLERATDKKIPITNMLGQTLLQTSPGTLVFKLHGVTYRLDAVEDEGKLFILFADQTSGVETYGTGRFLYADQPNAKGFTVLDFNHAINPPCAFTTFATCPLPPKQNRLEIAVTAGEKNYGEHE